MTGTAEHDDRVWGVVVEHRVRDLDPAAFLRAVSTGDPAWLGVLAATILAEQLTRGWKWRQILFDLKPISTFRLFGAVMAGYGRPWPFLAGYGRPCWRADVSAGSARWVADRLLLWFNNARIGRKRTVNNGKI